jgi:hypothetical protein
MPQMRIVVGVFAALVLMLVVTYIIRSRKIATRQPYRLVLSDEKGQELTPDDLADLTGTFNWSIVGGEQVSEQARGLLEQGRRAGASGKSEEALRLFAQAHEDAPEWPYPLYEAAYTHLLNGDLEKAEREYVQIEQTGTPWFLYLSSGTRLHTPGA